MKELLMKNFGTVVKVGLGVLLAIIAWNLLSGFVNGSKFRSVVTPGQRISDFIAKRDGYNAIWSKQNVWPEIQLLTTQSPILQYIGPENFPEYFPKGGRGYFRALLVSSDGKKAQWHDVTLPIPTGWQAVYWKTDKVLRADLASVVYEDGLSGVVVPVSQRTDDGVGQNQYWAYREDLRAPQEGQALASWGRSIVRNDLENDGRRQVLDRYTTVLERGQTSDKLIFQVPPVTQQDLERYSYRWETRFEGATLLAKINGQPYTLGKGKDTDASEAVRGTSVVLEITATTDAVNPQTPVEFVFLREIKEN